MAEREGALEELVMNPNFWRNKRVLITGHTGFKGSWLSLWLQDLGTELHGIALAPPTTPNLFSEACLVDGMYSNILDIRDYDQVRSAVRKIEPEIVIHMAAQPLVRYSYKKPIETYATNVFGTVHVLEALRETSCVKAIVNVTTDKCYENREWVWGYRENEPMGGFDPYSSSKGCAELVTSAYRRSFFTDIGVGLATARAGNVIGGGDWSEDRLIPDTLRAFERADPVIIRNPNATRPWQHVLEPLSGYLTLAERLYEEPGAYSEGWNFGPRDEDAKSVKWIVDALAERWGEEAVWNIDAGKHPHEAHFLKLDISKAQSRLNWQPKWTITQALDRIVEWHQLWMNHGDIKAVCRQQIHMYQTSSI